MARIARAKPIGSLRGSLCIRQFRAERINDRCGLWWPLLDCGERRSLGAVDRVGSAGCTWLSQSQATADIDVERLAHDRQQMGSWQLSAARNQLDFRRVSCELEPAGRGSLRQVPAAPFVPSAGDQLHARCQEIFGIQCAALTKRVQQLGPKTPLNIGVLVAWIAPWLYWSQ